MLALTLELRLAERRTVAGDDDQLALTRSEGFERRLESESDFTRLYDESQAGVDCIGSLLILAWRHLGCLIVGCRMLKELMQVVGCCLFAISGLGRGQVEGLARDNRSIIISYPDLV